MLINFTSPSNCRGCERIRKTSDVGKKTWRMCLSLCQYRCIIRVRFGKILSTIWPKYMYRYNIISGFRSTGIFSFDQTVIPAYFLIFNCHNQMIPQRFSMNKFIWILHRCLHMSQILLYFLKIRYQNHQHVPTKLKMIFLQLLKKS